jgi:hypothetical protein
MTAGSILQDILTPAGPQAAHLTRLWWLMFWVSAAVFVLVTTAMTSSTQRLAAGVICSAVALTTGCRRDPNTAYARMLERAAS